MKSGNFPHLSSSCLFPFNDSDFLITQPAQLIHERIDLTVGRGGLALEEFLLVWHLGLEQVLVLFQRRLSVLGPGGNGQMGVSSLGCTRFVGFTQVEPVHETMEDGRQQNSDPNEEDNSREQRVERSE